MEKVSVVLCVYNRQEVIERCIDAILSQSYSDFDLVIVDDGSSDGTCEILKKFEGESNVTVIKNEKNLGLMKSRNIGVKKEASSIIAFTDSDCIPEKDWLQNIVKPFRDDPLIVITGGEITDGDAGRYWDMVYKGFNFLGTESGYIDRVIGANMAFSRGFLIENPFDEMLKYGADETDLCMLARKKGKKVFFTKEAKVVHYHRNTLKGALKQAFNLGVGNCYYRIKYRILPVLSVRSILLLFCALSLVFMGHLLAKIVFWIGSLGFIGLVLYRDARSHRKTPAELFITLPGVLVIAFSNSLGYHYSFLRFLKMLTRKNL